MAWIKDTVRDRSGPSDFTEDRNWSQLPEAPFMAPQPLGPYDIPRKDTAVTLVKLYFTKVIHPLLAFQAVYVLMM